MVGGERSGYVWCSSLQACLLALVSLIRHASPLSRAGRSRNDHRAGDRSVGRDHPERLGQSHSRRDQLRAAGDDLERRLLHRHATTGRQLRRDRDRSGFPDDDTREHRGDGGQHGARRRAACRRRAAGCGHRDRGIPTGAIRQREGDDGDQQQVHSGSAARRRRAAAFAARPEPRRTGGQVRDQRRRRTREHRHRRRAGRRLGSDRRRRVGDARRAVRAAVVDDAQFPVGRSHHGVRGRHERVQGRVRPRGRRRGELRVPVGHEHLAGQSVRVLPARCARFDRLLQQGARPSEAAARAA